MKKERKKNPKIKTFYTFPFHIMFCKNLKINFKLKKKIQVWMRRQNKKKMRKWKKQKFFFKCNEWNFANTSLNLMTKLNNNNNKKKNKKQKK